jgi:hypothetical protein
MELSPIVKLGLLLQQRYEAHGIGAWLFALYQQMDVIQHDAVGVEAEVLFCGDSREICEQPVAQGSVTKHGPPVLTANREEVKAFSDVARSRQANVFAPDGHVQCDAERIQHWKFIPKMPP